MGAKSKLRPAGSDISGRNQVKKALRETEERFQALIDNSFDAIVIVDADAKFRYQSPSCERILGHKPEDQIGSNVFEFVHPDDIPYATESFAQLMQDPSALVQAEVRYLRGDGEWRHMEASTQNLLNNPAVEGVVVNFRDITERKQAEEALRESEARYRALFEASADGILTANSETREFKYANPAICEMLGYSEAELKGMSVADLHPKDSLEHVVSEFEAQSRGEKTLAEDIPCLRKDGTIVYADISATTASIDGEICAIGFFRDITKRKRAEEQVRLMALFAELHPSPVLRFDEDGMVLMANRAAHKLFRRKLATGTSLSSILPGIEELDLAACIHDGLILSHSMEIGNRFLHFVLKGVPDLGVGQIYGSDITERKKTEASLQKAHDELEMRVEERTSELVKANEELQTEITERKQAEEALQESEEKFRSLAEHSPNMIFINKKGRVVYVNEKCEEVIGYKRKEFYSPHFDFLTLIAPESRDLVRATFGRHMKGEKVTPYEYTLLTKEGRRIEAILTSVLVQYEGETAILGTVTDITEHKQAEGAIREAEKRYKAIFDNRLQMVYISNEQGLFLDANDYALERLGYTRDELGTISFENVLHPDDFPKAFESVAEMLAKGFQEHPIEVRLVAKSGEIIWVEVFGITLERSVDHYVELGIAHDITERKQMEELLRQQEKYFRSLIENASDTIVVLNSDGTLRYKSPSSKTVLGYKPEEGLSDSLFEHIHPDDVQKVSQDFAKMLQIPGDILHCEVRAQHQDGSWRVIEAIGHNLLDEPAVEGIVVNYRDITERKQDEAKLRESESRFRQLVEDMNDGYCVFQGTTLVFTNARSAMMFGYKPEEVVGKTVQELLPPHIICQLSEMHSKRQRGESVPQQYETTLAGKNGTPCPVELSTKTIDYAGGRALSIVIRDISERKKVEEELRASEEHHSALVGSLTDAVFKFKEGVVTWCNERVEEIYGYTKDELIGKQASFFYPEHMSPQEFVRGISAAIKKRGLFHSTAQFQRKDGNIVDVEYCISLIPGKDPIELITVARDITERKQAEEALRQSEEYFRSLIEDALDAIVVLNSDGTIRYRSPSYKRVTGYDPEETIGESGLEHVHPDDMQDAADNFARLLQEPGGTMHTEIRSQHKDGSWRHVEVLGRNLLDDPVVAGIVATFRDITERKQIEQQLLLSGRLASVGQLAAGVAHELNNPLAAVQAYAQFLASRKDLDETIKSDVETIYKEAQRATRITANLLSFARKREPEKSFISINNLIEESLELHAYRMNVNNIETFTHLDPNLPFTMADFYQLQQVFVNLITNAEQAMTEAHGKGKISIKTQRIDDMLQATFTDDGPGMPEDDLKRIFDPFFTTKDVGQGTGLGLSICYGIVQEHGGNLHAKSEPGKGTTFVVELPIISEDQPKAEQTNSVQSQSTPPG